MSSRTDPSVSLQECGQGVLVRVTVLPRASRTAVVGIHDGALKIKLTKPPVDGEANAECCRFLSKVFGVAKSRVSIAQGAASRSKTVLVSDLALRDAVVRLAAALTS